MQQLELDNILSGSENALTDRQNRLVDAGYDYDAVRREVNNLMKK